MTPVIHRDSVFSRFSLSVLKDSGWYKIDLEMGEQFFWGKGDGCSVFSTSCPHLNVTEYCSSRDGDACSDDHIYQTNCSKSTFTGTCKVKTNVKSCKVFESRSQKPYRTGINSMCLRVEVKNIY